MTRVWIGIIIITLLAGCTGLVPSVSQGAYQPPTPQATQVSLPSPAPTATAQVFEMRSTSTPLPTPTAIPTLAYQPSGNGDFPPGVNPLTGLVVSDPSRLERRPIAIKITNFPRQVRPQWGLSAADHIYEYYLETGLTRFIGVFYGQDAYRVGPVRSGRFFDENIVRMYKSYFVFGYADDRVVEAWMNSDLKDFLVIERKGNCPPICRIGPEDSYNNLFVDTQVLSEKLNSQGADNARQDLNGLRFNAMPSVVGEDGLRLSIRYSPSSYNRWEFDPARGRYLRFQDSKDDITRQEEIYQPLTDSLDGQPVGADNLIVLFVPHDYYYKSNSTEIFQMNFTGQGSGFAFRDGRMVQVQWQRQAPTDLVMLTHADGHPYLLKPGNVWYEVLGQTSSIEQQPDGAWRFLFGIP